jgi:hypothetical protein
MANHYLSGIPVKLLEKDAKYYLNRSTILFGASDSGKSTILIEILYLLKQHVPNIFIFSPTNASNGTFDGIIPSRVLYDRLDIDILKEIYKRQQAASKIYKIANNIQTLRGLFNMVASFDETEIAKREQNKAEQFIKKKESDLSSSYSDKKSVIVEIKQTRDRFLIKFYKSVIRNNISTLEKKKLPQQSKYAVKYLDFNPNCVVIFDDCGAELKKFQKEEVVKKIFFQGRHDFINLIITLQDDTNLDSDIKKNAFVSIFTTQQCASAYFDRKSNSFPKKEKLHAAKVISLIFADGSKKNYKKLVYLRNAPDPFRYTIANLYEPFKFGCSSLWKMCEEIDKNENKCDLNDDPLMTAFKINF